MRIIHNLMIGSILSISAVSVATATPIENLTPMHSLEAKAKPLESDIDKELSSAKFEASNHCTPMDPRCQ